MAKDILGEAGLHFDELNKLRVLDPEVSQQTVELKEECKIFVDKIGEFKKIVGNLIELVDQLAKATENEKIKAIGARNLLKSIAKQREAQQQQLQALIAEKTTQLERRPQVWTKRQERMLREHGQETQNNHSNPLILAVKAFDNTLLQDIFFQALRFRYRVEYETLCKIEADQNEFIDQFIFQK